jgi:hypothetical protein
MSRDDKYDEEKKEEKRDREKEEKITPSSEVIYTVTIPSTHIDCQLSQKLIDRIWSWVNVRGEDDCWPWWGGRTKGGYGNTTDETGHKKIVTRIIWEIVHGEVLPIGINACHKCDHPSCCNPKHLWKGTPLENTKDAIIKGKFDTDAYRKRASPHNKIEFTVKEKEYICNNSGKVTRKKLAWLFSVSVDTIRRVQTNECTRRK